MLPIKLSSTGQQPKCLLLCRRPTVPSRHVHVHNPIALVPRLSDIPTHSQCHHVLVYSIMMIAGGGGKSDDK